MVSQGKAIRLLIWLALVLGAGGGVTYGATTTFGFTTIFASSPEDALIGENQFFMDVLDSIPSQAVLRIRNTGPEASSIIGVFVENPSGVVFPIFSSPEEGVEDGINPGESLDITADLSEDITNTDVVTALENEIVRIALDAEGFPDGGTATFINNTIPIPPPGVIPAPGALFLGAAGAGLVGWLRRRRLLG